MINVMILTGKDDAFFEIILRIKVAKQIIIAIITIAIIAAC